MAPHALNNQLQSAPTMTDQKSAATRWWNGWYTTFAAFLGAFAAYIVFIVGRTTHGLSDAAPRPWNAIALVALSLGAILSYLAAGRLNRRRGDAKWQAAVLAAIHSAAAANQPTHPDDEPTVPVVRRGVVYATAVHGYGPLPEALKQWLDERIDCRIDGVLADVRRLSEVDQEMETPAGPWPADKVTRMVPHRR